MHLWQRGGTAVLSCLCMLALGACGEDGERYSDEKIVEKLNLEKVEGESNYAIGGDIFCGVSKKLLNDADEVQSAIDKDKIGLVVSSKEGNVGIEGVPPFADDCKETTKKKLNKLDPVPEE